MTESFVRLDQLASAAGLSKRSLVRWSTHGVVRGINRGRGPGNGIVLSRVAALEALTLLMLRRAGVPLRLLRAIAPELKRGTEAGFIALGVNGCAVMVDEVRADAPLHDPGSGQPMLGIVLDLRPLRRQVEHIVDELTAKAGGA